MIKGTSRVYTPGKDIPWKRPPEPKWAGYKRDYVRRRITQRLAIGDRIRNSGVANEVREELLEALGLDDTWFDPRIVKLIHKEEEIRQERFDRKK